MNRHYSHELAPQLLVPPPVPKEVLDRAACKGRTDLDFFPERGASHKNTDAIRELCRLCPVRKGCLEYALSVNPKNDVDGWWGGFSPDERRRMRRVRRLRSGT